MTAKMEKSIGKGSIKCANHFIFESPFLYIMTKGNKKHDMNVFAPEFFLGIQKLMGYSLN